MHLSFALKPAGLAFALLCGIAASAQHNAIDQQSEHSGGIASTAALALSEGGAEKTAATGSRLVAYSRYKYYTASGKFLSVDSSGYLYAAAGNALNTQKYVLTSNGGTPWTPVKQYVYTYDASGFKISEAELSWNTATAAYVNTSKNVDINNTAGFPTDLIYSTWTSGAWANSTHVTNTYNAANKLLTHTLQTWDAAGAKWVNNSRNSYTLNSAGHATSNQWDSWTPATGVWTMSGKVDSIFNSSGIGLVSVEFFSWDVPTSAWISNGRYLHTVDASNRTITEINQSYAPPTNAYSNSQKNVFTYYTAGNMLDRTGCNWDASAKSMEHRLIQAGKYLQQL